MEDRALVELAIQTRSRPGPCSHAGADAGVESSSPLAYALGWLVANAIVGARYADCALDVLPVHHPERGWDRFVITRRVTAERFAQEPADRFGVLWLTGPDAPRLTRASGAPLLALGERLLVRPEQALAEVLACLPAQSLAGEDLGKYWRGRQLVYPRLYRAVTELVAEYPGLVVAREIFIDTEPVDGRFHPLYLHGSSLLEAYTYDWILIQHGARAAFVRIHGEQALYETDSEGWSTVKRSVANESIEGIKRRMRGWLRICETPDPRTT